MVSAAVAARPSAGVAQHQETVAARPATLGTSLKPALAIQSAIPTSIWTEPTGLVCSVLSTAPVALPPHVQRAYQDSNYQTVIV